MVSPAKGKRRNQRPDGGEGASTCEGSYVQEKAWDAQLGAIDARGGRAEWTGNGYRAAGSGSRELAVIRPPSPTPPPKSMYAVGGKPGRGLVYQGRGMPAPPDIAAASSYTHAKQFEAQTTAVIAELVARDKDKERRIAALEAAAADRRTNALDFANALVGLLRFGLTGRAS